MDDTTTQTEEDALKSALSVVNIAEKKARIYSRLLTDTSLAKVSSFQKQRTSCFRKTARITILTQKPQDIRLAAFCQFL